MAYKPFLRLMRRGVNSCVDGVVGAMPFRANAAKVLLIRPDAIGDFIVWLDSAREIVRVVRVRGQTTVLLADRSWASFAAGLGLFDEVIPFNERAFRNKPWYRARIALAIRSRGCATAIHPLYSRHFEIGDRLIRLCGATERIGSSGDLSNQTEYQRSVADRWYTQLIAASPEPRMELLRNAEFTRGLLADGFQAGIPDLRDETRAAIQPVCLRALDDREPFYVLFPGAKTAGRVWPRPRFAEVAAFIHAQTGWRGVVCGGPDETAHAQALCRMTTAPLLNWAGQTSLKELCSVLARSKLLITNETSAVHLAAAVGTRSICICGGGHYGRFVPYAIERDEGRPVPVVVTHTMECFGCNWHCIYKVTPAEAKPCVTGVTVDQVCHAVEDVLRERV